jgi:hypothetical protein
VAGDAALRLDSARDLKEEIRTAMEWPRFAIGISLAETPGDYRVAIVLTGDDDRRLLDRPRMRRLIGRAEVDVEVAGIATSASSPSAGGVSRERTLRIGASVGHTKGGVGSLGFFAARRSDGKRGFVSCNHVIAIVDEGRDGDRVVSPSIIDGGSGTDDTIGALDGAYPRLSGDDRKLADCAFAVLDDDVAYDAASVEGGALVAEPAEIVKALPVTKIGRVTNARPGFVKKIEIDNFGVRYGRIRAMFDGVMQIDSASPERFSAYGDSGALIYTAEGFHPVGLLFAASYIGGPHNAGWTWANPIHHVTNALNVDLVTS